MKRLLNIVIIDYNDYYRLIIDFSIFPIVNIWEDIFILLVKIRNLML